MLSRFASPNKMTAAMKVAANELKVLRAKITTFYTNKDEIAGYDVVRVKTMQKTVEAANIKMHQLMVDIWSGKTDSAEGTDSQIEAAWSMQSQYEAKCLELVTLAEIRIKNLTKQEEATIAGFEGFPIPSARESDNIQSSTKSMLKPPQVPLPKFFSRDDEDITLFLMGFEETMKKFNYTDFDKLTLLKSQVKGKAEHLLASFNPAETTYQQARDALTAALANRPEQVSKLLERLQSIRLNNEPFRFLSDCMQIKTAFSKLEIKVEEILAYHILKGMGYSFRNTMVAITNTENPTLDQIFDKYHQVTQRYEASKESQRKNKDEYGTKQKFQQQGSHRNTATNAVSLTAVSKSQTVKKTCVLCEREGHWAQACRNYSTPKEKVNRLKEINGCVRCASKGHNWKNCFKSTNIKCRNCTEGHYDYLCVAGPKRNSQVKNSQINATGVECLVGGSSTDTILGTLTCFLKDGTSLRVFKDGGSQSNLIAKSRLTDTNHRVVEKSVKLALKGINGSKVYESDEIEMLFMFENRPTPVRLFTVEEIPTHLSLPKLGEIVRAFKEKGYNLADQSLHESSKTIKNLDVLLGASEVPYLNEKYIRFGENSGYLDSDFGVIIQGNVDRLIADLPRLQSVNGINQHPACVAGVNIDTLSTNSEEHQGERLDATGDADIEFQAEETPVNGDIGQETHQIKNELTVEADGVLIDFLVEETKRLPDGRLCMPLLFNAKLKHLLPDNYNLAQMILRSLYKKYRDKPDQMALMDETIKDLESRGIIEKVHNVEQVRTEDPSCSFLGHKPVFKPDKASTKCRIVFLSNKCAKGDKQQPTLSHNQVLEAGPCLNSKIIIALTLMRFGIKLLCFDLKKAFCQIQLQEPDQNKLLFFWFKDIAKGDYRPQAYRNKRLPFGLRPSPTMLMVALWTILVKNAPQEYPHLANMCEEIYTMCYMDNAAINADSSEEIGQAYNDLKVIFEPYKFELQQFATNDRVLQGKITDHEKTNNMLGLDWCTESDTIAVKTVKLDLTANTRRKVAASVQSVFDPLGINLPLLNRAKLFLQRLQSCPDMKWDAPLSNEETAEWSRICVQYNQAKPITVKRCAGIKTDKYDVICYTDSSASIYGAVIYLRNKRTRELHFLRAKNRLVTKEMGKRSIPTLELTSITLGADTVADIRNELMGAKCITPVKLLETIIYSDSLVAIHWINSFVHMEKQNKKSAYVRNRLNELDEIAEKFPFVVKHIAGLSNPADFTTRATSYKLLARSNYISGPMLPQEQTNKSEAQEVIMVKLPRIASYPMDEGSTVLLLEQQNSNDQKCSSSIGKQNEMNAYISASKLADANLMEHGKCCIPLNRYSSYHKLWSVTMNVLQFIGNLKYRLKIKYGNKYEHLMVNESYADKSAEIIIKATQAEEFAEVMDYMHKKPSSLRKIPGLISRMNLFMDQQGIIRVGSKMLRFKKNAEYLPILLPAKHAVTKLIIEKAHKSRCHAGVYAVLAELRKQFYVPKPYATVKRVLNECVHCRRLNSRVIKLNQNSYPEFRVNPSDTPFRHVFVDYMGPHQVYRNEQVEKGYILCITCIFSRAISLIYTIDLSTDELLMALQLHCFSYGMPESIKSDLGSQFVAGANILKSFLNTPELKRFLADKDIKAFNWEHTDKGNSSLASLVESCVKLTKRALAGSIGKKILREREFEFYVKQANAIINKRPIAFLAGLRSSAEDEAPQEITPEMLLHGRALEWTNIVPGLQPIDEEIYQTGNKKGSTVKFKDQYVKLRSCLESLKKLYNDEMVAQLIDQAVSRKDAYVKVKHKSIEPGDIVLLKEENTKPINYPMGRVKTVKINNIGEVVGAEIVKGTSNEVVRRHASVLIPILRKAEAEVESDGDQQSSEELQQLQNTTEDVEEVASPARPKRQAATIARKRIEKAAQEEWETNCNLILNQDDHDTLLSTVECAVKSVATPAEDHKLRVLLDTGSQDNLIDKDCLKYITHEIESEPGYLTISSILGKQKYWSQRVSMQIKIGQEVCNIEAYAVDKLQIILPLPGLSNIAKKIEQKGYKLADPRLSNENDTIQDINLVLGTYLSMLPNGSKLKFGDKSDLLAIPEIVLSGSIKQLTDDIEALPNKTTQVHRSNVLVDPMRKKDLKNEQIDTSIIPKLLPESYKSYEKYKAVMVNVFKFICKLKRRLNKPHPPESKLEQLVLLHAARQEQRKWLHRINESNANKNPHESGMVRHHHFDVWVPANKENACSESLLGGGTCRFTANPIIPPKSHLFQMLHTKGQKTQKEKRKKRGWNKRNWVWFLIIMLVSLVLNTSAAQIPTQATHDKHDNFTSRMIVDLPTEIYDYLQTTSMANSSEMLHHKEKIDGALTNWINANSDDWNPSADENHIVNLTQETQIVRLNGAHNKNGTLQQVSTGSKVMKRKKRAIARLLNGLSRFGIVRKSRKLVGRRRSVPKAHKKNRSKLGRKLKVIKSVSKMGLKGMAGVATIYLIYETAERFWSYWFGPGQEMEMVLATIKENEIQESILASDLSYISANEADLIDNLLDQVNQRDKNIHEELNFRVFALYALMQEERNSLNLIRTMARGKLSVIEKISHQIIKLLQEQLKNNNYNSSVSIGQFNMNGNIDLEGIDVAGRRLFLKITTPVNANQAHSKINQKPNANLGGAAKRIDPPKPESMLHMLRTMNQTQNSNIPHYEQIKDKVKAIKLDIQQAETNAGKQLKAAKALHWNSAWMSFVQLIIGILIVLALFSCGKFLPQICSRSNQARTTVWFATHDEELVCWRNEGPHE